MDLQAYLVQRFKSWQPSPPQVVSRGKGDITLDWRQREPFGFLGDQLLYTVEKNNKLPKWIVVYSGGKATKKINNLAPKHPHRFRFKIILKASAVPQLAKMALEHYGDENTIYDKMRNLHEESDDNLPLIVNSENDIQNNEGRKDCGDGTSETDSGDGHINTDDEKTKMSLKNAIDAVTLVSALKKKVHDSGDTINRPGKSTWIESRWSEETWTNTDSDGTSPVCFCMAVKCGYLKQVQVMVEERPGLVGIVNSNNGLTPLATAVRKGDINMVRFLLSQGTEVEQPSLAGQTPLHLAVLAGDIAIVDLLLEKGADIQARDWNRLRVEHYAVDSCNLDMVKHILDKGGDVAVKDSNGWTPLFRALCQDAKAVIISELVTRGSDVDAIDNAGLPLISMAKLLKNRHGRTRDSILRLVDSQYPREMALANFTRLTKKVYSVNTLIKN